jgi:ribose transport system ATP-binding protein
VGSGLPGLGDMEIQAIAAVFIGGVAWGGRGRPLRGRGILEALAHGVGYVPPDRRAQAIIRTFSVRASMTLTGLQRFSRLGFVVHRKERRAADEIRQRLDIKTRSIEAPILTLSGGNQQKVVLGRVLVVGGEVLVCDEPTAGVDVGARAEIYEILVELARQGAAIVVVSSDALELMGLCHRILVMREGRIVHEFRHGSVSEEELVRAQLPMQEEEEEVMQAAGA